MPELTRRAAQRAVDWFLARALVAAYHGRRHGLWIWFARQAARIAETKDG